MLLGAALRAWCTLFNRFAQGERKTLVTADPTRGSATRSTWATARAAGLRGGYGAALAALITWAGAFLVYDQVVRHEERRLLEKYGAAYQAYRARVGGWLPSARGDWPPALPAPFLPVLFVQSRALLRLLPFVAKAWALHVLGF